MAEYGKIGADHTSNYLVLKSTLGKDKQKLLDLVHAAIERSGAIPLREDWQGGHSSRAHRSTR